MPGACARGQGNGNKSFHLENEPRSGSVCLASGGPLVPRASQLGCWGPDSLKQPSLGSTPSFVPGLPHSPGPHIPWEFSLVLHEVEGLEREGIGMPKVGLIGGRSSSNGTPGRESNDPGYPASPIPARDLSFPICYREHYDSPLALGGKIES